MLRRIVPLADGNLLHHCHPMLTQHLPWLDPALQRLQGSLIATHIGEVTVELWQERQANALAHKAGNKKGIPDLLGKSQTYLLRLGKLSAHEDLSPIWKELTVSPKHQHLTTLQRVLSNTARFLRICTPIIAIPYLLNLTLSLGFILDHQDDLGTGLHQFGLGQHSSATQKVMTSRSDQHQVIAGGDAASSLEDAATLMAPYGVSLLSTMAMVQGAHT